MITPHRTKDDRVTFTCAVVIITEGLIWGTQLTLELVGVRIECPLSTVHTRINGLFPVSARTTGR